MKEFVKTGFLCLAIAQGVRSMHAIQKAHE